MRMLFVCRTVGMVEALYRLKLRNSGRVVEAIENYPYERLGWKKSDNAPYLGMGAEAETRARSAVPVEKL